MIVKSDKPHLIYHFDKSYAMDSDALDLAIDMKASADLPKNVQTRTKQMRAADFIFGQGVYCHSQMYFRDNVRSKDQAERLRYEQNPVVLMVLTRSLNNHTHFRYALKEAPSKVN